MGFLLFLNSRQVYFHVIHLSVASLCPQIGRVAAHADGVTQMLNSAEILCDVIQCISVERIAVAKEVRRPTATSQQSKRYFSRMNYIFCVFFVRR